MSNDRYFTNPVSEFIWNDKYKAENDKNIYDTWTRVARALANNEKENIESWYKRFLWALKDFKILPGGRILANAGAHKNKASTLVNCFVLPEIEDSMRGIMMTGASNIALTLKSGGGVGYNISNLRPGGDEVKGINQGEASGPVSFLSIYDEVCKKVKAGNRRGAMICLMDVNHPDIKKFIMCKDGSDYLSSMNLSVAITDKFMKAVENDEDFDLEFEGKVYKTVKAKELFDKIIRHTYEYSEPGVIFIDTVNNMNNLYYCETIKSSNPCGEIPLPPAGSCNLTSINLTKIVKDAFTNEASLDMKLLERLVSVAIRMADNVIDVSTYPLEVYKESAHNTRRIGLGITGLADMFAMLSITYSSIDAQKLSDTIISTIKETAYLASIEIAKEKGTFPNFKQAKYLNSKFIKKLPINIQEAIREFGIRNSHLLSIQPTGTVSLLANNISSGLEPIFSLEMTRNIKDNNQRDMKFELRDAAYHEAMKIWPESKIKSVFKTMIDLEVEDHIIIQAILQEHIDSSISKTINIKQEYPFDKFKDVYFEAYKAGLKGITTFRPTERMQGIISDGVKREGTQIAKIKLQRPEVLMGKTYKVKTPTNTHAYYITINDLVNKITGKSKPWEVFFNSKSEENNQWVKALSVLLSEVFKRVDDPIFIANALKMISDPAGGFYEDGTFYKSLVARIGDTLLEHLGRPDDVIPENTVVNALDSFLNFCPKCGERTLKKLESCEECSNCDYSRCG